MGDRALVIFVSVDAFGNKGIDVSPTAYLHNDGSEVPELLEKLKALMIKERANDESYALARFIGIVHSTMPGDCYSLGCFETSKHIKTAIKRVFRNSTRRLNVPVYDYMSNKEVIERMSPTAAIGSYSHGDAGVVVVDTRDYKWSAYGGYLNDTETLEDNA